MRRLIAVAGLVVWFLIPFATSWIILMFPVAILFGANIPALTAMWWAAIVAGFLFFIIEERLDVLDRLRSEIE